MIDRKCETCELHRFRCYLADCREPARSRWVPSRAALEAEVARLEGDLETGLRTIVQLAAQVDAQKALHRVALNRAVAAESERDADRKLVRELHIEERLAWTVRRVCAERDEARAELMELRKELARLRSVAEEPRR